MISQDHYLPVVVAALVVLILGCWNPRGLQVYKKGVSTGCVSYIWLALFALLGGAVTVLILNNSSMKKSLGMY